MNGEMIAVGDNCLDVYLGKGRMAVGGNALNVAVQWRLMGLNAHYFGSVGPDAEGREIVHAATLAGLDPDGIEVLEGSTAVTLILDKGGERHFLLEDLGVGEHYVPNAVHYERLRQAAWVHLGTNAVPELVAHLVQDGIAFSIDLSTRPHEYDLSGVPLVFASGSDEPDTPVESLLRDLLHRGAQDAVITCGKRGAFTIEDGKLVALSGRDIRVVDTCGAGDSFIAAFLAARLEAASTLSAIERATDAAAATCGYEGGFPQTLAPVPEWLLTKYADVIKFAGK